MSEQTQTKPEHPIFDRSTDDSQKSEVVTDSAKSTDGDSSQKPDSRSLNRDRQVKSYADRVEKGENSLDDIPDDQEWLKPLVKEEIELRAKSSDVKALVAQELAKKAKEDAKKADQKRLSDLKKQVSSLSLTESDRKLLSGQYDRLKDKGLSDADALEEALSMYETLAKAGEEALNQKKKAMEIPLSNKPAEAVEPEYGTPEWRKKGTPKERMEKMEEIRKSSGAK